MPENVCNFVFVLLLSIVGWGHVTQAECPSELSSTVFERSRSCYQFVNEERTWVTARAYCRARGGKMVTVDSQDVQEWLSARINELGWTNNGVWIGLNDRHTEGSYGWDGYNDTETTSSFSFWNTGEPSGGASLFEQDCVYMRRQYGWRWVDVECNLNLFRTYNFICQYPSLSQRPASTPYVTTESVATIAATRSNVGLSKAAPLTTTSPSLPSQQSASSEMSPTEANAGDAASDFAGFTESAAHSSGLASAAAAGGALKTHIDGDVEEKHGASHGAYVSLVAGVGVGLLAVTLLVAGVIVLVWQIRWRKSFGMRGRSSNAVVGMDNPVFLQDPAGGSSNGRGLYGQGVTLGA